jgi:hypothetical protein
VGEFIVPGFGAGDGQPAKLDVEVEAGETELEVDKVDETEADNGELDMDEIGIALELLLDDVPLEVAVLELDVPLLIFNKTSQLSKELIVLPLPV